MYVLELVGKDDPLAAAEAETAATDVTVAAPGVATAASIDPRMIRMLALTRRAGESVGRTAPTIAAARDHLTAVVDDLDRAGPVAVRARTVRETVAVDTQQAERSLGSVLTDHGYAVDLEAPANELRAVFTDGSCFLYWLDVERAGGFTARPPTARPFFQPGSMSPTLARTIANLARAGPGRTLLDPMCGTGGILIEAGCLGADLLGGDIQAKMVHGTRTNLDHYVPEASVALFRADATRLPICDEPVDAVAFDVPYGRQSKIAGRSLGTVVQPALAEARRLADRAVVVADRSWADAARDAGWTLAALFERRVHRSLTRRIHVLTAGSQ
ncbi:MAG: TIGR01177 family methyltransferase [Halobacteriales archaeon]|nr:TIGR01177 family methyltransferase [Halobacteriales archaeon]